MALQIIGSNTIGAGTRADLTTADDIFVMGGVTVGSTDANAITASGNSHRADIHGNVVAQITAIILGDSISANFNQEVVVRSGALVYGSSAGVWVRGYSSTVTNAGTIAGGSYGIVIGGINGSTTSTITNTGTIEAEGGFGIMRLSDSTEKLVINNSGSITAAYACYGNSSLTVEQITNTGRINGVILLDGGADLYDGRSGRLSGMVYGGSDADWIYGGVDNDTFDGGSEADTLKGYAGNDMLYGGTGADRMEGGTGNDKFFVDDAGDVVVEVSGQGTDTVETSRSYTLTSHVENLILSGSVALNGTGNSLANAITGNTGNNTLKGLSGNDTLNGGSGNDTLTGGAGADRLTGGTGADHFVFTTLSDSTVSSSGRDLILDFSHSQADKIDLSAIDASTKSSGNQSFSFIGEKTAFTGHAGELRYINSGGDTFIYADVNGDRVSDFSIRLDTDINLVNGDFIL